MESHRFSSPLIRSQSIASDALTTVLGSAPPIWRHFLSKQISHLIILIDIDFRRLEMDFIKLDEFYQAK